MESGKVIWYSHHFKYFPQFVVIHTVKGFGVVNKAVSSVQSLSLVRLFATPWITEVDAFLEFFLFFFNEPMDVGNLIFGSSVLSKSSLNIWKFTVHILLNLGLENFQHYFASILDECNCMIVWTFFGIAFLWDWNENWTFPVLCPLLSFPDLLVYWVQLFHCIIF